MESSESQDLIVEDMPEEDDVLVPYDIASYPSDLTLSVLAEMWKNKDIEIPGFQRNFVWSIKQSSLLIESFLLGLPVPQVFFYVDDKNKNLVIDGQQRILSVVYFFEGYFGSETIHGKRQVFRLVGLDPRSPYVNKKFTEFDEVAQRKLKNAVLRAINIRQLSPKGEHTSVYHIFERLNTGGTPLKPQEIRNCVFRGELVHKLKELNDDSNWRKILGKQTIDRHQKDVELILRLFALSNYLEEYEKPMKEFLNKIMDKHKDGKSAAVKKFEKNFLTVSSIIISSLGEHPFHLRGPLNSSALDSVFCALFRNLSKVPSDLKSRFTNLLKNDDFQRATRSGTTDVGVLQSRFQIANEYLIK